MSVTAWVCFFLTVSVLSLIVAWLFTREVVGLDTATPAMQQIAAAIAFLKRQYKTVAALLGLLLPHSPMRSRNTPAEVAKPTWCCRICRPCSFSA